MPKKIHILTLGGTAQPIIRSILEIPTERVVFIVSGPQAKDSNGRANDGSITMLTQPLPEDKDNPHTTGKKLIDLANITLKFDVNRDVLKLPLPDALNDCIDRMKGLFQRLRKEEGEDVEFICNYTGGTKTMSLALGLVAVEESNTKLYVTTGRRDDLVKVTGGESPVELRLDEIQFKSTLQSRVIEALNRYQYNTVISIMESYENALHPDSGMHELRIGGSLLAKALDAWDRYNMKESEEYWIAYLDRRSQSSANIEKFQTSYQDFQRVQNSLAILMEERELSEVDKETIHGYECVEDLLHNARRKMEQGFFDDAVGRIYRASESLYHIRLWQKFGLSQKELKKTKNKAEYISKYPEHFRKHFENTYQLTRKNCSHALIKCDEETGSLVKEVEQNLTKIFQARNQSIMGHGFQSIPKEMIEFALSTFDIFYEEFRKAIGIALYPRIVQFPRIK